MKAKQKLLISFSGGRTSARMTHWLLHEWADRDNWEIIVVFSNTGKEREETLEFVNACDQHFGFNTIWIEAVTNPQNRFGVTANVVTFQTANRDGKPFEDVIAKHGIPNQASPHCSRQLKQEAIRADEPKRINWKTAKKNNLIYPLVQLRRSTKSDINKFWNSQSFDLNLKSYEGNCDCCWKKSMRKLMTVAKENPKLFDWWKEMQEKYGHYLSPSRKSEKKVSLPLNFFRNQMTAQDIIEDAEFPFERAIDESRAEDAQLSLWSEELDGNFGCVESCEAF